MWYLVATSLALYKTCWFSGKERKTYFMLKMTRIRCQGQPGVFGVSYGHSQNTFQLLTVCHTSLISLYTRKIIVNITVNIVLILNANQ